MQKIDFLSFFSSWQKMIFINFKTIFDKLKKIFLEQFSKQNRVYNYRMTWTGFVTCRLEKVLLVLKCCKIGRFCNIPSFGRTAANFKYFLTREKPGESWDVLFSNSEKKKKIQALAKSLLEKIILNFAQKWQKFKNTFLALKWSKMIFFA